VVLVAGLLTALLAGLFSRGFIHAHKLRGCHWAAFERYKSD
jgi:high-affinity Fe2+/Pb2+ permease